MSGRISSSLESVFGPNLVAVAKGLAITSVMFSLISWLAACGGGAGAGIPTSNPSGPQSAHQLLVFLGDSITARWATEVLAPGSINKGVPGDSACDMLKRVQVDVIDLHPDKVHLLAGANGVTSDTPDFTCMAEVMRLLSTTGAQVYVGTMTPGFDRPQAGELAWNAQIKATAAVYGFHVVDYYPAMLGPHGEYFVQALYLDTVHPNADGYARMEAVFRAARVDESGSL